MSDDAMKALDEIEVALSEAAKWVRGDYASFCRDAMLRTLALLPTLRAALTPAADDEIGAIRARHEADMRRITDESDYQEALIQARFDRATLLRALDAERARRVEVEKLIRVLLENEPDDLVSDGGHTVLDLWRHEARANQKGTSDV